MSDTVITDPNAPPTAPAGSGRRQWVQRMGAGAIGTAVAASMGGAGLALTSTPAAAATITDADIFNFALNFEYLGAEYYLHAISGSGLDASLLTGTGTQGTVIGGSMVPFNGSPIQAYAPRLGIHEMRH